MNVSSLFAAVAFEFVVADSSWEMRLDSDAMSYFRAIATSGEKSERVVDLTEHIIRMNPAHYTVW